MDTDAPYYDVNCEKFCARTFHLNMSELYEPFLAMVRPGGRVLDAGCGSGRDALAFHQRGYQVTAFDASEAMVAMAHRLTSLEIQHLSFEGMRFCEEFDGIWACASLLHVRHANIGDTFRRFLSALKLGAAWYMSFKWGDGESFREGRMFSNFTEHSLREKIASFRELAPVRIWRAADLHPTRRSDGWCNAIVRKVASSGP